MKKLFAMIVALIMILAGVFPSVSSANSNMKDELYEIQSLEINKNFDINIIHDSKSKRVVELFDKQEGKTYKSTYDKKYDTFETVEIDNKTNEEKVVIKSSEFTNTTESSQVMPLSDLYLIDSGSNLNDKFQYYYYSQNVWFVVSENSAKNPVETTYNSDDLNDFRSSVNNLRGAEIAFRSALTVGPATVLIAAVTAPGPWAPIVATLTAAGVGISAISLGYACWSLAKDCRYFFGRITI